MIKLIIVFTLFCVTASAKDFTAEDARNYTEQRIYEINVTRIKEAAEDGRCTTNGYMLDTSKVRYKLIQDGYKIKNDSIGVIYVDWCME